jgi:hypothetical protein
MPGLIAALAILTCVGLALLVAGWRGRRINDHPICRKCRFDLVGAADDAERCPECGRDLTQRRAIRIGVRRRRWLLVAFGLVTTATSASVGVGSFAPIDWWALKPIWVLKIEAESSSPALAQRALWELSDRHLQGSSPALVAWLRQYTKDFILGGGGVVSPPLALVEQVEAAQPWTSSEYADFVTQLWTRPTLAVRSPIRAEDDILTQLTVQRAGIIDHLFMTRFKLVELQVDGIPATLNAAATETLEMYWGGHTRSPNLPGLGATPPAPLSFGEHIVQTYWLVEFTPRSISLTDTDALIQNTIALGYTESTTMEVVAGDVADLNPAMGSDVIKAVRDAIEVQYIGAEAIEEPRFNYWPVSPLEWHAQPEGHLVEMEVILTVGEVPYELAHRLFIRTRQGTWPLLGRERETDDVFVFRRGVWGWRSEDSPLSTGWGAHPLVGFASETADLILRPDFDAARIQWMSGLCGEEIVFENIPIRWGTRPPTDDTP